MKNDDMYLDENEKKIEEKEESPSAQYDFTNATGVFKTLLAAQHGMVDINTLASQIFGEDKEIMLKVLEKYIKK